MNDQSRVEDNAEKLHQQQIDNLSNKVKEYRSKCKQLENELLEVQNSRLSDMQLQQKLQQEINELRGKLSVSQPEAERLKSLTTYYQKQQETEKGRQAKAHSRTDEQKTDRVGQAPERESTDRAT